jgi:hypothetical protein
MQANSSIIGDPLSNGRLLSILNSHRLCSVYTGDNVEEDDEAGTPAGCTWAGLLAAAV